MINSKIGDLIKITHLEFAGKHAVLLTPFEKVGYKTQGVQYVADGLIGKRIIRLFYGLDLEYAGHTMLAAVDMDWINHQTKFMRYTLHRAR